MTDLYDYHNGPNLGLESCGGQPMNDNDIKLPPLPPLHIVPSVEPVDYPEVAQALMDYARAAVLADREARQQDELDAARYRWLRDKCDRWDGGLVVAEVTEFSLSSWSGDDLNAAIDAAMSKEGRGDE